MTVAWYDRGLEDIAGSMNWLTDEFRSILVDLEDYQVGSGITAASNATPIVITVATHGLSNGDHVVIEGVGGNTAANASWIIANVATNTFELVSSVGSGAYTSGGHAVLLNGDINLDNLPAGARVATSGALVGKSATDGYLDATDVVWSSVTGDQSEAIVIYQHTGTESTSRLMLIHTAGTNLPVTPTGDNITATWNALGLARV